MKQFAMGVHLYATKWNDFVTEPNWNSPWTAPGWLYDASLGSVPQSSASPTREGPNTAGRGGPLWPYLKNVDIYWCPSVKTNAIATFNSRANKFSSVLMNGAVRGYGSAGSPPPGLSYRTTQFQPSDIIFWQALESNPGDWNDGSSSPNGGVTTIHNLGTTVGVVDGHVGFMKPDAFYAEQGLPTKNRLYCNPSSANGR